MKSWLSWAVAWSSLVPFLHSSPIKRWAKDLNRYLLLKRRYTDKCMKKCSSSHFIREFLIKITRYYYTSIRMAKVQNTDHSECCWGCGATGTLIHCWWKHWMEQSLWKKDEQFLAKLFIPLPGNLKVSVTQLCPTLCNSWTAAHQVLLSMAFSRQEYWSRSPCLSPEEVPNPGIKPRSPTLQADSLPFELSGKPGYHPNELKTLFHTKTFMWMLFSLDSKLTKLRSNPDAFQLMNWQMNCEWFI